MDLDSRVIYVGTFSKAMLPFLRLGYVIPPVGLQGDFERAKRLADLGNPGIEQHAMAHFLESGGFDSHLRKAVPELRRRRAALLAGIARHCGGRLSVPDFACRHARHRLAALVPLRPARPSSSRSRQRRQHRLLSLVPYFSGKPPMPGLLLGYAGRVGRPDQRRNPAIGGVHGRSRGKLIEVEARRECARKSPRALIP